MTFKNFQSEEFSIQRFKTELPNKQIKPVYV